MPSGPRKRKSKRKNKSSVSPPHQGWLRTHMQMLKGPSLGNGSKGKEKSNPASQEAEPNRDRKGMDSLENEGSRVSATSTVAIESEAENSQNADDLKMFQATENTESSVSIGVFEHSLSSDINVGRSHGLEEKREDEDTEKFGVDSSLAEGVSSQRDASAPAREQENEQAAVGKAAEETPVLEVNVSAAENDEKLMVEADGSMETLQNGEMDANTPKNEIPHPPMVVRHAPVWNCCGLIEVLMSFQR